MAKWLLGFFAILIGGAMVIGDAEAQKRRLGSGGSAGAQRNMTNPPAQQKAAPAQQQNQQKAATPQQQPSRWGGILGGLALGGLLGYLLGGSGIGGAILGMLLLAGLVLAAVVIFRMLAQRRGQAPQPMQYAGTGLNERVSMPPASSTQSLAPARGSLPADFDAGTFLKGAKMNFIRLQAANDAGQVDDIREFTTDEMFAALRADLDARGAAKQRIDVVSLDAQLLEVVTEGDKHWASVHFSGTIREDGGPAEGFAEVWNLVKPADGSSGWLLAGIQQMN
ncbi:MAG TPA: Tim44-like domain-containing protein [Burkholderiales bacterium]|nr:Tim44-like domain-containing protein [Burkholderiales bacterium]